MGPSKMKKNQFIIETVDDYSVLFEWLYGQLEEVEIVLLTGDLGAGKTTFVKHFCRQRLGIPNIQSPTYALMNTHIGVFQEKEKEVIHADFYRLEEESELIELGIEDILDKKSIMFVEWPELLTPLIESFIHLKFSLIGDGHREVTAITYKQ